MKLWFCHFFFVSERKSYLLFCGCIDTMPNALQNKTRYLVTVAFCFSFVYKNCTCVLVLVCELNSQTRYIRFAVSVERYIGRWLDVSTRWPNASISGYN